jgi:hypothetical protein
MMGGILLSMNLALHQSFIAFAIAGIIAAFAIMLIKQKRESNQLINENPESYESNKQIVIEK